MWWLRIIGSASRIGGCGPSLKWRIRGYGYSGGGNEYRLVLRKSSIVSLNSAPAPRSLSLPLLPSPVHVRPSQLMIAGYSSGRIVSGEAQGMIQIQHVRSSSMTTNYFWLHRFAQSNCQPLQIVNQPTQGLYIVAVRDKPIYVSATALETSKAGKMFGSTASFRSDPSLGPRRTLRNRFALRAELPHLFLKMMCT